jgi:hypothetical protein
MTTGYGTNVVNLTLACAMNAASGLAFDRPPQINGCYEIDGAAEDLRAITAWRQP